MYSKMTSKEITNNETVVVPRLLATTLVECTMSTSQHTIASSPGRFFQLLNVRGRGKKRPGIHCTGGSAHVHKHYPDFG